MPSVRAAWKESTRDIELGGTGVLTRTRKTCSLVRVQTDATNLNVREKNWIKLINVL